MQYDRSEGAAFVDAISELARKAQTYTEYKRRDGTSVAVFPDGNTLELTPALPRDKTGTMKLEDTASFIDYVNQHKRPGTIILVRSAGASIELEAVIDHHSAVDAGWGMHRAITILRPATAWMAWLAQDRKPMSQEEFGAFLEERAMDVIQPSSAEILEIVTTLEATMCGEFRSAVRLQNGDRKFLFTQTTEARAGSSGELVIPQRFCIQLRPFRESEPLNVWARFKYRLEGRGVTFRYEIEQLAEHGDALLVIAREQVRAAVPGPLVLLGKMG